MSLKFARNLALAVTLGSVTLLGSSARPAAAQFTQDGTAYFVTGDYTLDTDVTGFEVMVGKDNATDFNTLAGTVTLDVVDNAVVTYFGAEYPDTLLDNTFYFGLNVFGTHVANVSGTATLTDATTFETGTLNISGGLISDYLESYDASTINVSEGDIEFSTSTFDTSEMNISGGFFGGTLESYDASTINITDGTIDAYVTAYDDSEINILDQGFIETPFQAYDNSTVNISEDAFVLQIDAFDTATVNIAGDAFVGFVSVASSGTVNVSGGSIFGTLLVAETGRVNITDGYVDLAVGFGSSLFRVSGGLIGEIVALENSVFRLFAGTDSASTIYQYSDAATVEFFGTDIAFAVLPNEVDPDGNPGVFYDVAWTSLDGTVYNTRYFDINGSVDNAVPQGAVFVVVPEAGTFTLILPAFGALGVVIARRKRK